MAFSGEMGRSRASWPRRLLVIAVGLLLAIAALLNALSNVARSRNPGLAMRAWPGEGFAAALLADRRLSARPDLVPDRPTEVLARRSIGEMAVNPRALRITGLAADAAGERARARQLFRLSEQGSRRDMTTQLWLIEDAVQRNDIAGVFVHYDRVLRTVPKSHELLLPVLSAAMTDPVLRAAMVPYVRRDVPWLQPFLHHAIDFGRDQAGLAAMLVTAGRLPAAPAYRVIETKLLSRLVDLGDYRAARAYYVSLPGADAAILDRLDFSRASTEARFAPLTWQPSEASSRSAGFETRANNKPQLRAYVSSGERGLVLRRLIFLPPGRYVWEEVREPAAFSTGAQANWTLSCLRAGEKKPIWRSDMRPMRQGGAADTFFVPATCPAQLAELELAAGADQEGMELVIKDLSVARLGASGQH